MRDLTKRLSGGSWTGLFAGSALCLFAGVASAYESADVVTGDFVIENFEFHNGDTIAEMNVRYYTLGNPDGKPVLMLHGSTGTGDGLLKEGFADELFGEGKPFDLDDYFVILPDAIGAGGSSKPSDGLRASYPSYNLDDMVAAQHALVTEHLGIDKLHVVMGDSMGGMLSWSWAVTYPDMMNGIVPMASLPAPMSGRNWMMRRMLVEAVKTDPLWHEGNYEEQPPKLQEQMVWFAIATANGDQRLQEIGATRKEADAFVDMLMENLKVKDANDMMYRWNASRDYDPSGNLEDIKARVLVINALDDERNRPSLGLLEPALKRIKHAEAYLIPASASTKGHLTTGSQAGLYADVLAAWLEKLGD